MTQQEKPFTSGEAFYEARQNIKAAELFANADKVEKAYVAAFIAEKWTGLAQSLTLREQSARWDATPQPLPYRMVDSETAGGPIPVPDSWHNEICWHLWEPGTNRCRECSDEYSADTANQPCPGRCLHLPPTEKQHKHDISCFHYFKLVENPITPSHAECERCSVPFAYPHANAKCPEGNCPDRPKAPKHEHGPECAHDWRLGDRPIVDSPHCANGCRVDHNARTKNDPCPAMCPVTP